jgi:hypothetical protein
VVEVTEYEQLAAPSKNPWRLPQAPPSPAGGLTFSIPCWTTSGLHEGQLHSIAVDAQWQPALLAHDVGNERVAVALGGAAVTCLHFVDKVLPVLKLLTQRRSRRAPAEIRVTRALKGGTPPLGTDLSDVAPKETTATVIETVADQLGADLHLVKLGFMQIEAAYGDQFDAEPEDVWDANGCTDPSALSRLWAVGIHPALIRQLQDAVLPAGGALSASLLAAVVGGRASHSWVAGLLAQGATEREITWLAWTTVHRFDLEHPNDRLGWLREGLPLDVIQHLALSGVPRETTTRFATVAGLAEGAAAAQVMRWMTAISRPAFSDERGNRLTGLSLQILRELGVREWHTPSRGDVLSLWQSIAPALDEHRIMPEQIAIGLAAQRAGIDFAVLVARNVLSERQAEILRDVLVRHGEPPSRIRGGAA